MTARCASLPPIAIMLKAPLLWGLRESVARILVAIWCAMAMASDAHATTTISYTVIATAGDSWSGSIEVSDLNAPIASVSPTVSAVQAAQNNTWVSASANGYGSFPTNQSDGQFFGAPQFSSYAFGFQSDGNGIIFVSSSLYADVYEQQKTWNDLIAGGPYGIAPAGLFEYAASFVLDSDFDNRLIALEGGSVTFAPVPEPSTYAMALAGLACGGFSMWRRRKRA